MCARLKFFTLVELLIIIAIIAILSAFLLPALNSARETSRGIKCVSQIRQIGIAAHSYIDDSNGWWPISCYTDSSGKFTNKPSYGGILHLTGYLINPVLYYCPSALFYKETYAALAALQDKSNILQHNTIYDYVHYNGNQYFMLQPAPSSNRPVSRFLNTVMPSRKIMLADCVNVSAESYYATPVKDLCGNGKTGMINTSNPRYISPLLDPRHNKKTNIAWCDGHVTTEKDAWKTYQHGAQKTFYWNPAENNPYQ